MLTTVRSCALLLSLFVFAAAAKFIPEASETNRICDTNALPIAHWLKTQPWTRDFGCAPSPKDKQDLARCLSLSSDIYAKVREEVQDVAVARCSQWAIDDLAPQDLGLMRWVHQPEVVEAAALHLIRSGQSHKQYTADVEEAVCPGLPTTSGSSTVTLVHSIISSVTSLLQTVLTFLGLGVTVWGTTIAYKTYARTRTAP